MESRSLLDHRLSAYEMFPMERNKKERLNDLTFKKVCPKNPTYLTGLTHYYSIAGLLDLAVPKRNVFGTVK